MDWLQLLTLAIVQGLTEFLPISSSAHLIIPGQVLGWPDQGLAFDIAVHAGTLLAVIIYFRNDIIKLASAWVGSFAGRGQTEESRMVWYLGAASVPVAVAGLFAGDHVESQLRTLPVIAATTLVFGLLLGYADKRTRQEGSVESPGLWILLAIGLAQALALVPGVSRSGITITAALLLGLNRQLAARYSFLLSIPVIGGAGALQVWKIGQGLVDLNPIVMLIAAAVSAVTAYWSIAFFLRLLDRVGLMPFVWYRIALAGFLVFFWLWR